MTRAGATLLAAALLGLGLAADAPATHLAPGYAPYRVGFLRLAPSWLAGLSIEVRLRALGYREDRNSVYLRRYATDAADLAGLARELVEADPDVLIAVGLPAARAARAATDTIPIVMVVEGDPVREGLVDSLEEPGGNVTGVTARFPGVEAARLRLLREALPGLSRVGVLWNPAAPAAAVTWSATAEAAAGLGLTARAILVSALGEVGPGLEAARAEGVEALLVVSDRFVDRHARQIGRLVAATRLPVMYPVGWFLETQRLTGLLALGPPAFDLSQEAARQAARVLAGARPATLPVRQPTRLELTVDLQTADVLGIRLPPALVLAADHVLE